MNDDEIYKGIRDRFQAETEKDPLENRLIRLSVTNNGRQWQTVGIPQEKIQIVIDELEKAKHQ